MDITENCIESALGDVYTDSMCRIILVEDHAEFRSLLSEEIDEQPDMECVGIYGTAPQALAAVENDPDVDIIILDLGLPTMGGLEALPRFRELVPDAKVMVLTISEDRETVMQALALGASGYILKTDLMERMLAGLRNIMRGEAPMSPSIAALVLGVFCKRVNDAPDLSNRELDVLKALSDGMSRKQVAASLDISYHTVNVHVRNIYEKLHVHNLSGALRKASSGGLI